MNCKFQKSKKGFTIVELLIVLSIMIIMTGVLYANQNSKKSSIAVESAGRIVAAQIRALQNESLNGKKIGTEYANQYIFDVAANATTYSVSYKNTAGTVLDTIVSDNFATKKVKFNSTVSFYFKSPSAAVNPSANYGIVIVSDDGNSTRYVCVSTLGAVTEQSGACPA